MNIVDTLKHSIGPDVYGKLGGLIGSDADSTREACGAAIPALLAGMAHLGSTPDGARKLSDAVDAADENAVQHLGGLPASQAGSVVDKGREMLGSLMGGGGLSSLSGVLGKFTGMGGGTMLGMLGGLAPLLLGALKRIKSSMGLDAGGLAGMLAGQRQNIAAAMPQGLGSMLSSVPGLGSLSSGAREVAQGARGLASSAADTVNRYGEPVAAGAGRALRWLIPGALAVILGVWLVAKYANRAPEPSVPNPPQAVNPAPSIADDARTAGAAIAPAVNSATDQVKQVVTNATDALSGITDPASADAALPKLRDLSTKVDGLSNTVGALPASARKPVNQMLGTGYTRLKELADKAMGIPGVGDRIRPVVDPMLSKLQALSAG